MARLDRTHVRASAVALARAFDDDPLTTYLFPDVATRPAVLRGSMAATVRDGLPFGEAWGVFDGSTPVGAAVWLPPGAHPMSPARRMRYLAAAFPGPRGFPAVVRAAPIFLRLYRAIEKVHPHRPQWYLGLLGLDPAQQGRGGGTRVLEPGLGRCDEAGLFAYLETSKEANLAWYGRHGFTIADELRPIPKAPPVWTMERSPTGP